MYRPIHHDFFPAAGVVALGRVERFRQTRLVHAPGRGLQAAPTSRSVGRRILSMPWTDWRRNRAQAPDALEVALSRCSSPTLVAPVGIGRAIRPHLHGEPRLMNATVLAERSDIPPAPGTPTLWAGGASAQRATVKLWASVLLWPSFLTRASSASPTTQAG